MLIMSDFRRHVRPFFLTPDGTRPTKYKPYYDFFSYIVTQAVFSFTTAPFVLLTLPASLLVWSRVYFYAIIGVAVSMAFFASPGKVWLIKQLNERNHSSLRPSASQETLGQPLMGLPSDPQRDVAEAVQEIKEEVELRRRRGNSATMPTGIDLKEAVEDKLGKKL